MSAAQLESVPVAHRQTLLQMSESTKWSHIDSKIELTSLAEANQVPQTAADKTSKSPAKRVSSKAPLSDLAKDEEKDDAADKTSKSQTQRVSSKAPFTDLAKKKDDKDKKDDGGSCGCCSKPDCGCCPGVLEDSSIHNTGFYLNGNDLQGASNIIIYGTGSQVQHSGGGVANGGGVGPGGVKGGGHQVTKTTKKARKDSREGGGGGGK